MGLGVRVLEEVVHAEDEIMGGAVAIATRRFKSDFKAAQKELDEEDAKAELYADKYLNAADAKKVSGILGRSKRRMMMKHHI